MELLQNIMQQLDALTLGSLIVVKLVVATVVLLLTLFIIRFVVSKLKNALHGISISSEGLYFRNWEIIPADHVQNSIEHGLELLSKIISAILILLYLLYTMSFFEVTKQFSNNVINLFWDNLQAIALSFMGYLPKLVFVILIFFITKWVINLFRTFMSQIEHGRIKLHMFPEEYAAPTRQLITFAIVVFAMVIVAPYLPGSGSDAFKGVTVFLGILVSLGSTTAIANIIASFVIQYMRAFKVGDTVQIGNHTGTIISINLFSTRMYNFSNEYISIPNGLVLTGSLTNYSKKKSTAVEVGISIGYDVPWREVHAALLEAAKKVEGIADAPEPFVLQKSLDDFYVSYRLYAFVENERTRPHILSRLNESIRDYFEEQNIEILSPAHTELRNSEVITDTVTGNAT